VSATCPKCGGKDVKQVTPALFECETEVQTDWFDAPPEVTGTGMFERHALYGPCGHRFQVPGIAAAPPCEIPRCGRDSVGRCQGQCGRRLCGLCGAPRGPFICADCLKAQAEEKRRVAEEQEEAASRKREKAARQLADRRQSADQELAPLSDPIEILHVLERKSELLGRKACAAAWVRLAETGSVTPGHQIATVFGRGHFLICGWQSDPGWNWHERGKREDAWFAAESDIYFDNQGREWRPTSALLLGGPNPFLKGEKNWVALPHGARFHTRLSLHGWGLVLLPNSPPRTVAGGQPLSRVELSDDAYARAMTEILRGSESVSSALPESR